MLAHTRLKLKNAENSISFIQEEHTRTLEGLHKEIQKLQQKNARLTFELAVQGSPAPSKAGDCCKQKEEELQSCKAEVSSLHSALSTCKEQTELLKRQLLSAESVLSQEVGLRDAQINALGVELQQKSKIIAHLTKKLQHVKLELAIMTEAIQTPSAADNDAQKTSHQRTLLGLIRRRVRRATASALPHDPNTRCQHCAESCQEMLTRRSLPTPTTRIHTPSPPTPRSITPRPPSTSPPQRLLRRTSRGAHRAAGSVPNVSPPQDKTPTELQRPCSTFQLDPVQLQKPAPSDVMDLLKHENSYTPDVYPVTRSSPPVLPPIPTTSDLVASPQDCCTTHSQYCPAQPSGYSAPQGHVILTRSQQPGSSPASSVQRLTRRKGQKSTKREERRGKQGVNSQEGEMEGRSTERMLLVKDEIHQGKNQAWQELHQSGSD